MVSKRCKCYEDFKEIEEVSKNIRERYPGFAHIPESEFVICNIKCREYDYSGGRIGCVFNNNPDITRCPECAFSLREVEQNKISLYKLRELFDAESEW